MTFIETLRSLAIHATAMADALASLVDGLGSPVEPPLPGDPVVIPPVVIPPAPPPVTIGYDLNTPALLLEAFNHRLDPTGEPEYVQLASLGFAFAYGAPVDGFERMNSCYRWTGAILPMEDGEHIFTGIVKSAGYVMLGGDIMWSENREGDPGGHDQFKFTFKRTLEKGKLCSLKAAMIEQGGEHVFDLKWLRPGKTEPESIPSLCCVPPSDWKARLKTFVPPVVVPGPQPASDIILPPLIGADYQTPDLPADFMAAKLFEPWLADISAKPVDPKSAAYIASLGSFHLHPGFGAGNNGIPIQIVPNGTPEISVAFDVGDESDGSDWAVPLPPVVEGGGDPSTGDVHWLGTGAGYLLEVYQLHQRKSDGKWYGYQGTRWKLDKPWDQRPAGWTSADAAGLPITPGLVRYQEVAAGEINHALRCTVGHTQKGYCNYARHWASTSTDPNLLPTGAVIRLKSSVDISGFPSEVQVILRCLKKYGMVVADNGSPGFVMLIGTPDRRWPDEKLGTMKTLGQDSFEVVETGPITK